MAFKNAIAKYNCTWLTPDGAPFRCCLPSLCSSLALSSLHRLSIAAERRRLKLDVPVRTRWPVRFCAPDCMRLCGCLRTDPDTARFACEKCWKRPVAVGRFSGLSAVKHRHLMIFSAFTADHTLHLLTQCIPKVSSQRAVRNSSIFTLRPHLHPTYCVRSE